MTNHQMPRGELEDNVRRLFGRLERGDLASQATRERILERLLQGTAPSQSIRTGLGVRRWVRWGGLAAVLFVAAAILTDGPFDHGEPRGRRAGAGGVGSMPMGPSTDAPFVSFAMHLVAGGPGRGVVNAASAEGGAPVHILPERHVSNADVRSAHAEKADYGCQVSIQLTDEGTAKLTRLTRDHIGDQLALVVDGKVVMTPTIRSEITQGLVLLTGKFSDSRCKTIARGLSTSH